MNRKGLALGVAAVVIFAGLGVAQQKATLPGRVPEEQVINSLIDEMLAAWQFGEVEMMHKHYADDVSVVSGDYEPPIYGWANYAQAYQRQRERVLSVQLQRLNTYVNVKGNWAWATYQWEFRAVVDAAASVVRGHTTLVLEKRAERWLIVHNHTSVVPVMNAPAPAPQLPAQKPGA